MIILPKYSNPVTRNNGDLLDSSPDFVTTKKLKLN